MRRTVKPLREVQIEVGVEKLDMYKGVSVKALLDSGATGLFADRKFMEKQEFKNKKLARPIQIRNIDRIDNNGGIVTCEIECNLYYKGHIEQVKMDVCNLERTKVILGMPWLVVHNPEIDQEKGEVKMTRCLPLCRRNKGIEESRKRK